LYLYPLRHRPLLQKFDVFNEMARFLCSGPDVAQKAMARIRMAQVFGLKL
jgi:hypothetical protein